VSQNTTQNSLLISEIRDGMVIMSDGSFRAVIACKSINFDLMSSREREGVEFSYQNFLNALYFPVQIFIRSQRVDIGPYIDRLSVIRRSQDNMLLNVLMDDYINFIDVLSQEANIMDKSFFIIVPFYPTGDLTNVKEQAKGFFGKIFAKPQTTATKIDKASYEKAKDEIKNRVDSVISGLFQLGVKSVKLNTKELGELYYNMYNPDTAVREPLGDFDAVTSTYVKKGQGEAPRPHLQEGSM
jgi:type IV secretory pathway VirB4 component